MPLQIPQLTPAGRILEVACQLDSSISQHPKKAPMDELVVIELLRKLLLGEIKEKHPPNSIQILKK